MASNRGSAKRLEKLRPEDFISRDVPPGHDTLWGWAAKWAPQDLPDAENLATGFAEEQADLLRDSAANGWRVVEVAAPSALRALGEESVPAFETPLLYMRSRS